MVVDDAVEQRKALDELGRALLFNDAHTAYRFSDEPVTPETLKELYELVKWAPTSANTTPLRIVFLASQHSRARLLPHMSEGNREKTEHAPMTAILAADINFHDQLPKLQPHREGARERWVNDPERRERSARFNATLQAGYFILAVRALGLSAGPMLGFDPVGIDNEFFAKSALRSVLVVNLGYPSHDAYRQRSPRLEFVEAVQIL